MIITQEIHEPIMAIAPLLALGAAAAASAASKGISKLMDGNQDQKQLEQQQKLQDMQLKGAKEMSDYNQEKSMAMWHDTNYGAQRAEMEKAGLSPGLMYGLGGGGGATTQGAAAQMPSSSGSADSASRTNASATMNLNMLQAANIAAQTRLTNVQADKIAGIDTTKGQEENKGLQLDNKLKDQSMNDQLEKIAQEANLAQSQAHRSQIAENVEDNTKMEKMSQIRNESIASGIEVIAKNTGVELDKAKIGEIATKIEQKWRELALNQSNNMYNHNDRLKAIAEYTKTTLQAAGLGAAVNAAGLIAKIAAM